MSDLPTAEDLLFFWFHEIEEKKHFVKDEDFDQQLRDRFAKLHHHLQDEDNLAFFTKTSRGKLAAILVFDQFSRNMFRGEAASFAQDARALALANNLIKTGEDITFTLKERVFLYMPFQHSENLEDQARSVALFETLGLDDSLRYAKLHEDVVRRFGRFPHRNKALGRKSTEDEILFINTPGSGF